MQNPLRKLEEKIQHLVESNSDNLFAASSAQASWLSELKEAFLRLDQFGEYGQLLVPQIVQLALNTEEASSLLSDQQIVDALTLSINEMADQFNLERNAAIELQIKQNPDLKSGEAVFGLIFDEEIEQTRKLAPVDYLPNVEVPEGAFFIVNGIEIFPLNRPIVNIGRKRQNHLVLEDSQVSRRHGQLKVVEGAYQYVDLNSSGGSELNGEPVSRAVLFPGDVLKLAGVPLIYGQDSAAENFETHEMELGDVRSNSGPTDPVVSDN